jgi:predicted AAA+ superfamily ATPase
MILRICSTCTILQGVYLERILELENVPKSYFLFGPRQTGKTSLLRSKFPDVRWYDLLETGTFFRLSARPRILRDELLADGGIHGPTTVPVVVDEIQKLPVLLDEVQLLIDRYGIRFILTGSSARKLTRSGTNLLGGRARVRRLFPLVSREIGEFDLGRVLRFGFLPSIYFSDDPRDDLESYCGSYLQQEIQQEGIVRRIDSFARFLKTAATMNTQLINYEAIASDSAVPARTVREYFAVLEDTLIAEVLKPYRFGTKRKAIATGRLYFFDIGVAHALCGAYPTGPATESWGRAFEHFIFTELRAWLSYMRDARPLTFWRTRDGVEVDFIVGDDVAIEVKANTNPVERHLRGLKAIREEGAFGSRILVYPGDDSSRVKEIEGILVLPVREFLSRLWNGAW